MAAPLSSDIQTILKPFTALLAYLQFPSFTVSPDFNYISTRQPYLRQSTRLRHFSAKIFRLNISTPIDSHVSVPLSHVTVGEQVLIPYTYLDLFFIPPLILIRLFFFSLKLFYYDRKKRINLCITLPNSAITTSLVPPQCCNNRSVMSKQQLGIITL